MKECVDEGILQSYFDGELSIDMMEKVSSHLTSCLMCKRAARELEAESLILSEALEPEFGLSVPTDRLRSRIDAAIAERSLLNPPRPSLALERGAPLARRGWDAVAELFALSPQRTFAYAGIAAIILFAITLGLVYLRPAAQPNKQTAANTRTPAPAPPAQATAVNTPPNDPAPPKTVAPKVNQPRYVTAGYTHKPTQKSPAVASTSVKLLPGERSYLKRIAALDSSLKSNHSKPMRPALQGEYERNLAMVDRAIAATRNAAKNNPNDPDAAEFMYAAYQTKVDLLNQVADARLPNRQQ
jgi:anti-sigma factor RsiW